MSSENYKIYDDLLVKAAEILSKIEYDRVITSDTLAQARLDKQIDDLKTRIKYLEAQLKANSNAKAVKEAAQNLETFMTGAPPPVNLQIQINGIAITGEGGQTPPPKPLLYFRYNYINLMDTESKLVGREVETLQLAEMTTDGSCIIVWGVGGQGKTALVYHHIKPHLNNASNYQAVVWFTLEGRGTDLHQLAGLLGLNPSTNARETAELVRQYLLAQPIMLALDGLEATIGADENLTEDMADLLPRLVEYKGKSRILITSRELPRSYRTKLLPLEGLNPEGGVKLLIERGLGSEPPDKLLIAATKAGGNPFALKLLADLILDSFTGDTLDSLLQEGDIWDQELSHQLLQKTWDTRLNQAERNLLEILAVLRPPSPRPALLALLEGCDDRQLRELLNNLAIKSLVTAERDLSDGKTVVGHSLPTLLRRFILVTVLTDPAGLAKLHRAAAAYYQALIPTLPLKENYGRKQLKEVGVILEAVYHLNQLQAYEAAYALFITEGLDVDLDRWGQNALLIEIYPQWVNLTDVPNLADKKAQAQVLTNTGSAFKDLGKAADAIPYHQTALKLAQELGNLELEGRILGKLGWVAYLQGKAEDSLRYNADALIINRAIGNKRAQTVNLGNSGLAYLQLGQPERGLECLQEALAISQAIKNQQAICINTGYLGWAYQILGQAEEAVKHAQTALEISRQINDRSHEMKWLNNLGVAARHKGDFAQAQSYYEQALIISRAIGDLKNQGIHLSNLAAVLSFQGKISEGLTLIEQALTISRDINNPPDICTNLANLGYAHFMLAEFDQALTYYQQAFTISQAIDYRRVEGFCLTKLGETYLKQANLEQALTHLNAALALYQEIELKAGESEASGLLGEVYLGLNQPQKAIENYQEALALSLEVDDKPLIANHYQGLGNLFEKLGDPAQALTNWQQAQIILTELKSPTLAERIAAISLSAKA